MKMKVNKKENDKIYTCIMLTVDGLVCLYERVRRDRRRVELEGGERKSRRSKEERERRERERERERKREMGAERRKRERERSTTTRLFDLLLPTPLPFYNLLTKP